MKLPPFLRQICNFPANMNQKVSCLYLLARFERERLCLLPMSDQSALGALKRNNPHLVLQQVQLRRGHTIKQMQEDSSQRRPQRCRRRCLTPACYASFSTSFQESIQDLATVKRRCRQKFRATLGDVYTCATENLKLHTVHRSSQLLLSFLLQPTPSGSCRS